MNLLFYLTQYPGVGGIERVTNIIVSELKKENSITIISHISQSASIVDGVDLFSMPNKNKWNATENLEYISNLIELRKFDAIIYQDSYAPTERIAGTVSSKYNIPLFVFEHNSPLFVYNKRNLDKILSIKGLLRRVFHKYLLHKEIERKKYLLSCCKKYILLSKQFIPEFCNLLGTNCLGQEHKITFINNPCVLTTQSDILNKENIVLCVSRLAKEKSVYKMLYLWKKLSKQLSQWQFIIVGDGPERHKLQRIASKLDLKNVEFVGYSSPTEYYKRAKIFWMTSKFEGWGMTLVEAMQFGCIPIAFKTFSSIVDIIEDGKSGFLIEPDNQEMFINRNLSITCNDDLRRKISSNCIIKVKEFDINTILKRWNSLLTDK